MSEERFIKIIFQEWHKLSANTQAIILEELQRDEE